MFRYLCVNVLAAIGSTSHGGAPASQREESFICVVYGAIVATIRTVGKANPACTKLGQDRRQGFKGCK